MSCPQIVDNNFRVRKDFLPFFICVCVFFALCLSPSCHDYEKPNKAGVAHCHFGQLAIFIKMKEPAAVDPDLAAINKDDLPQISLNLMVDSDDRPNLITNETQFTPEAFRLKRLLVRESTIPLTMAKTLLVPGQTRVCYSRSNYAQNEILLVASEIDEH